MAATPTTKVEIDTELLERLRAAAPGKPDRELIEDLARLEVGFGTIRRIQDRTGLSEGEGNAVAVQAVREVRRDAAGR